MQPAKLNLFDNGNWQQFKKKIVIYSMFCGINLSKYRSDIK